MNLRCKLLGCCPEEYGPACVRCGSWLYDWRFVDREQAWLSPWYRFTWWFAHNKWYFYHKCETCGRRMFFIGNNCCSDKCYETWCPF